MNAETQCRDRHGLKKFCVLCGELYCPGDGCDPYHVEACREARLP